MPPPPGGWPADDDGEAWRRAGLDRVAMEEGVSLARPSAGTVLTPPALSHLLASRVLEVHQGPVHRVLDPAVGTGSLICAIGAHLGWDPACSLVGWDIDETLLARASQTLGTHVELRQQDALNAEPNGAFDVAIANPPFVPEKGNRALFGALAAHPRWQSRIGARVDLSYLFVHLVLDQLRVGGTFGVITPAYWPTATGGKMLRADLSARAELVEVIDLGPLRVFDGARGLHTLLTIGRRVDSPNPEQHTRVFHVAKPNTDLSDVAAAIDGTPHKSVRENDWHIERSGQPWFWHIGAETRRTLTDLDRDSVALGDWLADAQGVVSGADRDKEGEGIFVLSEDEAARLCDEGAGQFVHPMVRGSRIAPFTHLSGGHGLWMLYLRGGEDVPDTVLRHLGRHRPRLERRREVQKGVRPWWALQWPRAHGMLNHGKLVCPRRATHACFGLDSRGLAVSSDCTYLQRVDTQGTPSGNALHAAMNCSMVDYQLQHRGKRKGRLIELYAQPLRDVRLPNRSHRRFWQTAEGLSASGLSNPDKDRLLLDALDLDGASRSVLIAHWDRRWQ